MLLDAHPDPITQTLTLALTPQVSLFTCFSTLTLERAFFPDISDPYYYVDGKLTVSVSTLTLTLALTLILARTTTSMAS